MIAPSKNKEKAPGQSQRGLVRIAAWLALPVAIAVCTAILYFALSAERNAADDGVVDGKPGLISKVQPQITVADRPEPVTIGHSEDASPEETKVDGERQRQIEVIRQRQEKLAQLGPSSRPRAPYEIFNHPSENRIAGLLTMKPGTPMLVPPNYSHRFVEDFKESCKEPILIEADDSDYEKQLKRDMIACKIELCNRMATGEDLASILSEAHREFQKLGQVKYEIEKMVRQEIRENAKSADDVDSLIEAANVMLENQGIAPLNDNPVLRQSFYRFAERNSEGSDE